MHKLLQRSGLQKELSYHICLACRRIFIFDDDLKDHRDKTKHDQFQSEKFDYAIAGKAVYRVQLMLHQAIITSLHSLGERPTNAIIWYLKTRGVLIDSKNLDIRLFYEALQEIIGPAADTVVEDIMKHLRAHYRIERGRALEQLGCESSPLARLQDLLKQAIDFGGCS